MKRLALACVLFAAPACAADLGVIVTGLVPETGPVRVLVTPEAAAGEAEPQPLQALAQPSGGGQAAARFSGLAPGAYRIVAQDGRSAIGQGRVVLDEPAATAQVALAPEGPEDVPVHPNAVEWERRMNSWR